MTPDEARLSIQIALDFLFDEDGYTVDQLRDDLLEPMLRELAEGES